MRPEFIGELFNAAIPFFGGIYATLLGFRVVGKKPGASPKYDEWHSRFGSLLKLLGPLLVLFGLFLAASATLRVSGHPSSPHPSNWQRYRTSDGICSAEFPQPPKEDTNTVFGIESNLLTLYLKPQDLYYTLTFSDIPANAPAATTEERLDSIRDDLPAIGAQKGMKYKLIREGKISEKGVIGRELEFTVGDKHTCQIRVFIIGRRVYRVIAVAPRGEKGSGDAMRFLESFRIEDDAQER
jgi:hypothetical protein